VRIRNVRECGFNFFYAIMLAIIVGGTYKDRVAKTENVLKGLSLGTLKDVSKVSYVSVLSKDIDRTELISLSGGLGFFNDERVVVIEGGLEDSILWDVVVAHARGFVSSAHKIFFREEDLSEDKTTKLKELGGLIFTLTVGPKNREYFPAGLTDALLARDRKNLWITYMEEIASGKSPEELHGLLVWQMNALAQTAHNSVNPGLKPFVYEKCKKAIQKYSHTDIEKKYTSLISLVGEARSKNSAPLHVHLSRWILEI